MHKLFSRSHYLLIFALFLVLSTQLSACGSQRLPPEMLAEQLGEDEIFLVRPGEAQEEALEEAANIEAYFQYRFDQMKDSSGTIPDGALMNALDARAVMEAAQKPDAPADIEVAGINSGSWTAAGPGNIGGRIRAILPLSASTVFIGSVSGGLWKTTNCCSTSTTWTPVNDFMANLAISSLIVDPTNASVMYAGTGEGFFNADAVRGAGVFKSTDGGTTWTQLASTNNSSWYYVNRLAISPNGANLIAATGSGLYYSSNGGSTWTLQVTGNWKDVRFDPTNSNYAVAAGSGYSWYTTGGGGSGWAAATGLPGSGRIELVYAPSNPSIVYASVEQSTGAIYKSTDGGHSYTVVNGSAGFQTNQGWYDNTIWVNPTDPNNVVAGGLDLYQSTDGAMTFTKISDWTRSWPNYPASPHADHHALVSIPGSSTALINGNDGGLYYTSDISTAGNNPPGYNNGWVSLNNNLGITQFYGVAGNANGVLYGGSQDNGVSKYTPGAPNAWTFANGGDGGKSAADPTNPNYLYNEYTFGKVNRSTDGGTNTDDIYGTYYNGSVWVCRAAPYRIDDACNTVGNFIAPILLDPNNPNRLFVGGLSLWVTDDARTPYIWNSATAGPQWAALKPPIAGSSAVNAIAVAPGNSSIIWVGYKNGQVDMTTDGGTSWSTIPISGSPGTMVSSIAIDQNDNNVVYVGFTGFGTNRIWRTANGGGAWSSISNNLPQAPVYALAINPSNSSWLYVATEIGLFASENTGATWNVPVPPTNGDGPANVAVFDLQWVGGGNSTGTTTLIAGTHGRGAYFVDTIPDTQGFTYADPALVCGGNTPCYATIKEAIDNVILGGTATIYAGTYGESVSLNKAATVSVVGNITINDVSLYNGSTWNAGSAAITVNNVNIFGGTWNAGTSTLTVNGDWAVSGTFNIDTGTVVFAKNGSMTLSDASQVGGTISFCNLTIGANTLVDVTDDFISAATGGSCTQYVQHGQLTRTTPTQDVLYPGYEVTYTFKDARNRDAVVLGPRITSPSLRNTFVTVTSNAQPGLCVTDPFPAQPVLRQYVITGTFTGGSYPTRLYYTDNSPNESGNNTLSNLAIYHCNITSGLWEKIPGTGGSDANGNYVSANVTFNPGWVYAIGANTSVEVVPGTNGGDGPGGVGVTDGSTPLELWLQADKGVYSDVACTTTAGNGNSVACWRDQSGNAHHAMDNPAAPNQPTFKTNILNTLLPTIGFDGNDGLLTNNIQLFTTSSSGLTVYTVFNTNNNAGQKFIINHGHPPACGAPHSFELGYDITGVSAGNFGVHMGCSNATVAPAGTIANGLFYLMSTLVLPTGTSPGNVNIFQNGSLLTLSDLGTGWVEPGNYATTSSPLDIGVRNDYGSGSYNSYHNGDIAEVIIFTTNANPADRTLVENYLSAKYNLTVTNDIYDGDTFGAGDFDLDVAGIGQLGGTQHTLAYSAGMIVVNSTFLTENGDWLLFGHRTPTNANVTTELPSGGGWDGINDVRWARHWYIDVTDPSANNGRVNIIFDFSEAGMDGGNPPAGPASNYRLLKRSGPNGSFTDITALSGATVIISGDQVQFWGVDVAQLGSNFTLGSVDQINSPTAMTLFALSAHAPSTPLISAILILLLIGLSWGILRRIRHSI